MNMFLVSIKATSVMLLVMLTGVYACKRGWVDADKHSRVLAVLVSNVFGTCSVFYGMVTTIDRTLFLHYGLMFITGMLVQEAVLYGCWFFARKWKALDGRRGLFASLCALPNILFIGLPIANMILGEQATAPFMMLYVSNVISVWMFGYMLICRDGGSGAMSAGQVVKHVLLSPPVIAFFLSAVIILLDIKTPDFLIQYSKLLAGATSPVAVFYIGMILYQCGLSSLKFDAPLVVHLLVRFIAAPLLALLAAKVFGFDKLSTQTTVLAFCMPNAIQTAIFAQTEGSDYALGMRCTVIGTLLCIVVVPVYMFLLA